MGSIDFNEPYGECSDWRSATLSEGFMSENAGTQEVASQGRTSRGVGLGDDLDDAGTRTRNRNLFVAVTSSTDAPVAMQPGTSGAYAAKFFPASSMTMVNSVIDVSLRARPV